MKPFLLLMLTMSVTATAQVTWNGTTDQLSLGTLVNSGPTYETGSGAFSGTFSIDFSGLGSIDSPVFNVTIPVDFSLYSEVPGLYLDVGAACLGTLCVNNYSERGATIEETFQIEYPGNAASDLEPLLVPISLTTSAMAESYWDEVVGTFPTSASAAVTVDFGDLVLTDAFGNNVTSEVSFTVTPPIPEPGSFVLAGVGLLALAVRRIRRPFARN